MRTKPTKQMIEVAERIAAQSGASVGDVLARFDAAVKKSSLSASDLFLGDSVITLNSQNVRRRGSAARSCGVSRRRVAVKGDA